VATGVLAQGTVLAHRYRLVSLLGKGGAGSVYLAEDVELFNRKVAVKELIEQFGDDVERDQAIARFTQEAKMLVTLSHPNLPDVRAYFTEGGRYYLVMEYIDGSTLFEQLQRAGGALPPTRVVDWGKQVCDVLTYLHGHVPPVVFRDIKPSNVMVDQHGQIKLIDFGTARHFDVSKHTDTLKMGSIGYAAPEQYQGQGQTSPLSDIYALGATLHQLLTNADPSARPFVFTPPSLIRTDVPEGLSRAVMRAVSLDPAQRFPSAQEMRRALELAPAAYTTTFMPVVQVDGPQPWLMAWLGIAGAVLFELVVLAPELPNLGKGIASRDWPVDYGVMVAAALGAALGGAFVPGLRRRVVSTFAAFDAALLLCLGVGVAVIAGIGHGDPKYISLRLLAVLCLLAAVAGASLMRGLGVGE